jgi:ComF family protein
MCPKCAAGKNNIDWMRSACVYDDFSRNVVLPFKHAGQTKFKKTMSRAMIFALREMEYKPDIVLPVPLANRRLFKRGYNQATLLARPIAKHFGARLDIDSIWREYREDMGNKTAKQRAANVRGVFHLVRPEQIKGKKILLVDDVVTSGASFAELRRVLKRAGASAVYGISFCRVVRAI